MSTAYVGGVFHIGGDERGSQSLPLQCPRRAYVCRLLASLCLALTSGQWRSGEQRLVLQSISKHIYIYIYIYIYVLTTIEGLITLA